MKRLDSSFEIDDTPYRKFGYLCETLEKKGLITLSRVNTSLDISWIAGEDALDNGAAGGEFSARDYEMESEASLPSARHEKQRLFDSQQKEVPPRAHISPKDVFLSAERRDDSDPQTLPIPTALSSSTQIDKLQRVTSTSPNSSHHGASSSLPLDEFLASAIGAALHATSPQADQPPLLTPTGSEDHRTKRRRMMSSDFFVLPGEETPAPHKEGGAVQSTPSAVVRPSPSPDGSLEAGELRLPFSNESVLIVSLPNENIPLSLKEIPMTTIHGTSHDTKESVEPCRSEMTMTKNQSTSHVDIKAEKHTRTTETEIHPPVAAPNKDVVMSSSQGVMPGVGDVGVAEALTSAEGCTVIPSSDGHSEQDTLSTSTVNATSEIGGITMGEDARPLTEALAAQISELFRERDKERTEYKLMKLELALAKEKVLRLQTELDEEQNSHNKRTSALAERELFNQERDTWDEEKRAITRHLMEASSEIRRLTDSLDSMTNSFLASRSAVAQYEAEIGRLTMENNELKMMALRS
mmetsp:Transcript_41991/g.68119  ORF Transcript_41991/g.68119 Transcript_41991/m.68119 type:complete len:524 (+) Transcript_41991:434-2005(+)